MRGVRLRGTNNISLQQHPLVLQRARGEFGSTSPRETFLSSVLSHFRNQCGMKASRGIKIIFDEYRERERRGPLTIFDTNRVSRTKNNNPRVRRGV